MSSFLSSLKNLLSISSDPSQARDERFLAQAVDLNDLERRIRLIDSGRHHADATPYGIFAPRT